MHLKHPACSIMQVGYRRSSDIECKYPYLWRLEGDQFETIAKMRGNNMALNCSVILWTVSQNVSLGTPLERMRGESCFLWTFLKFTVVWFYDNLVRCSEIIVWFSLFISYFIFSFKFYVFIHQFYCFILFSFLLFLLFYFIFIIFIVLFYF